MTSFLGRSYTPLHPRYTDLGARFSINREGGISPRKVKENRVIRQQLPQIPTSAIDFEVFHRVIAAEALKTGCFPYTKPR